jgi:ABC-type glycerol-3-phosphate transport system substrate-binding protein
VVAACGQSTSSPAGTSAPATSAPAAAAPAASGAGPLTLSGISWNSGSSADAFKNAMSQINDQFKQKRSNVTVNFEPLGQGCGAAKL